MDVSERVFLDSYEAVRSNLHRARSWSCKPWWCTDDGMVGMCAKG